MPDSRALFLDRDGVINHDEGYTSSIEKFRFIDGIFDICRAAKQLGYLLIVVTNQAGIGRGYYSEQEFLLLTEWMRKRFVAEGAPLTDVFYCPYHPEYGVGHYKQNSPDRKPNPGMLLRAAVTHDLNLPRSIMIGDKASDMEAASNAGVGTRWQFLVGDSEKLMSSAATRRLSSLVEGLTLLREPAFRSEKE